MILQPLIRALRRIQRLSSPNVTFRFKLCLLCVYSSLLDELRPAAAGAAPAGQTPEDLRLEPSPARPKGQLSKIGGEKKSQKRGDNLLICAKLSANRTRLPKICRYVKPE